MSFREKSAWITFLLLLLFGAYFGGVVKQLLTSIDPHAFRSFALWAAGIVIFELVMHAFIAIRSPMDARTPSDERERLIALRATRLAFYVLLVGAFLAIGTMHLGASTWVLAHCVLFAVWLAELTRQGSQIYYYRRGV